MKNGPKAEKIEQLFDKIAPDYDRLNHLLSLNVDKSWRRKALKWIVDISKPQNILDLACGTGDFSIAIARKVSDGTTITGFDLSAEMLKIMTEKVKEAGVEHIISTKQGNGETLPFDDFSFDRVTIAFGIRNFEHREKALQEILRVLKPAGRLVILELSVPSLPVFREIYNLYFTKILPTIGGIISGSKEEYHYLPASVIKFPGKDEWMGIMSDCGFINVQHKSFSAGICRMYIGEKQCMPDQF